MLVSPYPLDGWNHRLYDSSLFFPLVSCPFNTLTLKCPAEGLRFIEDEYGENWTLPRKWKADMVQDIAPLPIDWREREKEQDVMELLGP